jgi:DNA sulfur modification protein DndC
MAIDDIHTGTVRAVSRQLIERPEPWILGFSGGKDSSCVVKLVYQALLCTKRRLRAVTVLYCDTGVEIPIVRAFVWQTLTALAIEARKDGIPLKCDGAAPRREDRFFFKVIGRGYVPPTNKFRWCTDRLRIRPIQAFINKRYLGSKIIALGIRKGESHERDRTIARHRTSQDFFSKQEGCPDTTIYTPILNYNVADVWNVLAKNSSPCAIDSDRLMRLYRHANGECPIVREATSIPCAGSRFGCWTCTVVRKDRAMEGLITAGYSGLRPLLEFRNWLSSIRDDARMRWPIRRNGAAGIGPFTLAARRTILDRLLATQRAVGLQLIAPGELQAIKQEWNNDRRCEDSLALNSQLQN